LTCKKQDLTPQLSLTCKKQDLTPQLSLARTSDPHSASAQFFINVKNNDFLNHSAPTAQGWGYCVFGRVVEGKDVVDKIRRVATGNRGFHQDVPAEDVVIRKAERVAGVKT
jgi:peptidyl-prolyl cis-trans isomerase B (cyclophilin B)